MPGRNSGRPGMVDAYAFVYKQHIHYIMINYGDGSYLFDPPGHIYR